MKTNIKKYVVIRAYEYLAPRVDQMFSSEAAADKYAKLLNDEYKLNTPDGVDIYYVAVVNI